MEHTNHARGFGKTALRVEPIWSIDLSLQDCQRLSQRVPRTSGNPSHGATPECGALCSKPRDLGVESASSAHSACAGWRTECTHTRGFERGEFDSFMVTGGDDFTVLVDTLKFSGRQAAQTFCSRQTAALSQHTPTKRDLPPVDLRAGCRRILSLCRVARRRTILRADRRWERRAGRDGGKTYRPTRR